MPTEPLEISRAENAEAPRRGPERLCSNLRSAWSIVADITERLASASSALRGAASHPESMLALRDRYAEDTGTLLTEPAKQFLQSQPLRRSLEAMKECEREIPARLSRARAQIDQQFQWLLARTALDLCEPWRIWRSGNYEDEWRDWDERRAAHFKEASALLERYARWAQRTTNAATDAEDKQAAGSRETLWRQHRAVVAALEMEVSLRDLGGAWFDATEDLVGSMHRERVTILGSAEQTLQWIREGAKAGAEPSADALNLASPEERMRVWAHVVESESARRLPERAELVIPGRYPRWRSISPREAFLNSFTTCAQPAMRAIVERYWGRSAELIREVSRAREIIGYWREASPANTGDAEALFRDARHNATAMLAEHLQTLATEEDLNPH